MTAGSGRPWRTTRWTWRWWWSSLIASVNFPIGIKFESDEAISSIQCSFKVEKDFVLFVLDWSLVLVAVAFPKFGMASFVVIQTWVSHLSELQILLAFHKMHCQIIDVYISILSLNMLILVLKESLSFVCVLSCWIPVFWFYRVAPSARFWFSIKMSLSWFASKRSPWEFRMIMTIPSGKRPKNIQLVLDDLGIILFDPYFNLASAWDCFWPISIDLILAYED